MLRRGPCAPPTVRRRRGAVLSNRRVKETIVLVPRQRRRIGRPRPLSPGPRYPHRPDRLPALRETR
ncbi:hypothetical protein GCM10010313_81470 [Streptomyces violarus]|nr:hypothetical protein GCM10010313_81470 [Streptomyces violarus]